MHAGAGSHLSSRSMAPWCVRVDSGWTVRSRSPTQSVTTKSTTRRRPGRAVPTPRTACRARQRQVGDTAEPAAAHMHPTTAGKAQSARAILRRGSIIHGQPLDPPAPSAPVPESQAEAAHMHACSKDSRSALREREGDMTGHWLLWLMVLDLLSSLSVG